MSRRIASFLVVVLAALSSTVALGDAYKGGPAGKFSRPAMAVRAAHKDAAWARTIASENGMHIVAWGVKGSSEVKITGIDSDGLHPAVSFVSGKGTIVGVSRSGKSAIVEIAGPNGTTLYHAERVAGKRAHKTTDYKPFLDKAAYRIYEARTKSGAAGDQDSDWHEAVRRLAKPR